MVYDIAGLRIRIENVYPYTDRFCREYRSPDQNSAVDLAVRATKEEIEEEKLHSPGYTDGYIENICIYRALCLRLPVLGRFLMHSAVLAYRGDGYAFLGRSGTGKSTHTGLWLQYLPGAEIVNGDKPIIREQNGRFYACGTPWMGKESRGKNFEAPLKALCFLEQKTQNCFRRLTLSETSSLLFSQLLLPSDEQNAAATLGLVDRLIASVPAYLLGCNISEDAVKTAFEGLTGKNYESEKTGRLS